MKWILIGAMIAGLVAWCLYQPVIRFFAIDSCLDRGGTWEYDTDRCVFTEP